MHIIYLLYNIGIIIVPNIFFFYDLRVCALSQSRVYSLMLILKHRDIFSFSSFEVCKTVQLGQAAGSCTRPGNIHFPLPVVVVVIILRPFSLEGPPLSIANMNIDVHLFLFQRKYSSIG